MTLSVFSKLNRNMIRRGESGFEGRGASHFEEQECAPCHLRLALPFPGHQITVHDDESENDDDCTCATATAHQHQLAAFAVRGAKRGQGGLLATQPLVDPRLH